MWQFYAISQIGVDAKGLVIDDQITRAHERAVEFCNCYLTFFFVELFNEFMQEYDASGGPSHL